MIFAREYTAELIGTFIFSLGINMSTLFVKGGSQIPNLFSIMASLFCGITLTRNVSGGHVNGAVSLAFAIDEHNMNKRKPSTAEKTHPYQKFFLYFIYQIIGATLASTLSWTLYHGHILTFANTSYNLFGIFCGEIMGTFVFVYNILIQSENRFSKNKSIGTLLIVIGLFTAVNITSTLSAGCVNPSLAIGHGLARIILKGIDDQEFGQIMMYVISNFVAAIISGAVYNTYFRIEVDDFVEEKDEEDIAEELAEKEKQSSELREMELNKN